jgi:hypothetical protein
MFLLSGCGNFESKPEISQETEIPIASIAQSAPYGVAPIEPAYLVIRDANDWKTAKGQLPEQAIIAGMEAGMPSGHLILAAYAGVQTSSGSNVKIKSVMQQNDSITVVVVFSSPGPNEIIQPSNSLPFHIVSVAVDSAESWSGYTLTFQDEHASVLKKIVLP